MNEDEKHSIYMTGLKAGIAHAEPSKKTLDILSRHDEQLAVLIKGIEKIGDRFEDLHKKGRLRERMYNLTVLLILVASLGAMVFIGSSILKLSDSVDHSTTVFLNSIEGVYYE